MNGRLDIVEEVLRHLHTKICQDIFTHSAAVARRNRIRFAFKLQLQFRLSSSISKKRSPEAWLASGAASGETGIQLPVGFGVKEDSGASKRTHSIG